MEAQTTPLAKIPTPAEINARLTALVREEIHLRALLRLAVKIHQDDVLGSGDGLEAANAR
jgi:hypothetical protein